jgi:hypothetical protein
MTKEDIEAILKTVIEEEATKLELPSQKDWINLEEKFSCSFNNEFKAFIELMSRYDTFL